MPELGKSNVQWQHRQRAWRKRFWQTVWPTAVSRPVFLIGCGRSGTSMLVWQLDQSWQVNLYNEDHPAAFDNFRLRDLTVIDQLIAQSRAPITVFKPILDTVQTPKLIERYANGRFVFAFRNYSDVVNSSLKKFGVNNRIGHVTRWINDDFSEFSVAPPPEKTKEFIRQRWQPNLTPEEGAALYWLFYNRLYFDLNLNQSDKALLICYETLVQQPEQEFQRLCQFLDISFEQRMADGIFASSIGRDPAPNIRDSIRVDCENLYAQLSAEIEALAGT
jgi:hypothetical protein